MGAGCAASMHFSWLANVLSYQIIYADPDGARSWPYATTICRPVITLSESDTMTSLSTATRDMLYSLSWYMSARQTALRAALSFRTPLSVTDQMDMRVNYSGYFLNLLGATELCCETTALQPNSFKAMLYARLVFEGFQNGEANYSYIRELRNAIVHRGLDITSDAHIDGDFLMILAEPAVVSRPGKNGSRKTYGAFDPYLLHIIAKCELVIGPVMLEYLNAAGVFEATTDADDAAAEYREAVRQSHAMPEEAKKLAEGIEFDPEWAVAAHRSAMIDLRLALAPCSTAIATPAI